MGCTHSSSIVPEVSENMIEIRREIFEILNECKAGHMGHHTLESYTTNGLQDATWSPNMTQRDRLNLDRLWYICTYYKNFAKMTVSELMTE